MNARLAQRAAAYRREAATHRRVAASALRSAARYDHVGYLERADFRRAQAGRQIEYAEAADAAADALEHL